MMCNANLMLVVVMLWTGSLTLASPQRQLNMMRRFWERSVCIKYDLIENAEWIPRDRCEDNKQFRCRKGYRLEVQTSCKNGQWCLEPTCQLNVPTGCNYTLEYFNGTTVQTIQYAAERSANQSECDEKSPAIFAAITSTRDECLNRCLRMTECVIVSYVYSEDGNCYIYNVTLDQIPESMKQGRLQSSNALAEKVCE
ncbi:hypothetical protein LOTGIDRAFT_166799 [Lottia gigantea]|uniref:PAN-3 domain-containing protein n=1 Tax=Lottia gigantea TaxID=225164 RepID=V4BDL3_LOTGI|nr:hypothetical protein LOTGIDRAFT_166799 [Lottia gigantea]ESO86799.1 hypothetical protein LOTGIDRAFT_166799 [Lottia gigantea]